MKDAAILRTAAIGLFLGCILGMAGSIIPSNIFRTVAWAVDSAALILAAALLTVYYFRKENDLMAAGFLVFVIAETVVFSSSATNLDKNLGSFGAGTLLWAVSIAVLSSQKTFPLFVRGMGIVTACSFAVVSFLIFTNHSINALARPLPFYAYPFFAATLIGWAWTLLMTHKKSVTAAAGRPN